MLTKVKAQRGRWQSQNWGQCIILEKGHWQLGLIVLESKQMEGLSRLLEFFERRSGGGQPCPAFWHDCLLSSVKFMLENRAVHSRMFSVSLWSCVGYSYLSWAACLTCLKGSGLGNWKMLGSSIITRVAFGGWWLHLRSAGLMTFGWLWESWAPGKSLVNSCLQPGFLFKKTCL